MHNNVCIDDTHSVKDLYYPTKLPLIFVILFSDIDQIIDRSDFNEREGREVSIPFEPFARRPVIFG